MKKSVLQDCCKEYSQLLAMEEHWLPPSFYVEREAELARLETGEDYDYSVALICTQNSLTDGKAFSMSHLWRLIAQVRNMLEPILTYQFGEKDQVVLQYVCDLDRVLSLSTSNAKSVLVLQQDIRQMLVSLEALELQKIRRAIHLQRTNGTQSAWCGIEYFFSYKRKLLPAKAINADVIEETLDKIPLMERKNVRHDIENEPPKVQKDFLSIDWGKCERRFKILLI